MKYLGCCWKSNLHRQIHVIFFSLPSDATLLIWRVCYFWNDENEDTILFLTWLFNYSRANVFYTMLHSRCKIFQSFYRLLDSGLKLVPPSGYWMFWKLCTLINSSIWFLKGIKILYLSNSVTFSGNLSLLSYTGDWVLHTITVSCLSVMRNHWHLSRFF